MADNKPNNSTSSKMAFTGTQWWVLVLTVLGSTIVFIDGAALNVALAALQVDLAMDGSALLWVVNGYALFVSSLLLLGGSLGDNFGRNKVYLIGLVIFSIASLFCGISQNGVQLIISRCIQGIGGALLIPGSLSILSANFGKENRGMAIGLWSTAGALTSLCGPLLGGWLAGIGLWRYIFFVNLPVAIFLFVMVLAKIPESKSGTAGKLDLKGAILITLSLLGFTFALLEVSERGITDFWVLLMFVLAVVGFVLFIQVERKSPSPMVPLSMFKRPIFTAGNVLTFIVYGAFGAVLFFVPLNLIVYQGYSELEAGLTMLPVSICMLIISPFIGRYVVKKGPLLPLTVGPLLIAIAFVLMAIFSDVYGFDNFWNSFFIAFVCLGIGLGILVAPLTTTVMNDVSEENIGVGSGVNNMVSRASSLIMVVIFGALGLFMFSNGVIKGSEQLGLSPHLITEIEKEVDKFTAAEVPEDMPDEYAVTLKKIYKTSFVSGFKTISYFCAMFVLLGAGWTYFKLKRSLK